MGSRDWRLGIWIYVSATDDDYRESENLMLVVCELTIALVFGTDGTPYEGGVFRMKLILSHDFPQTPPKGADLSLFVYSLQSSNFVDEVANFVPFPGLCFINSNFSKVNDVRGFSACLFIACQHHD